MIPEPSPIANVMNIDVFIIGINDFSIIVAFNCK